jgi:tetratricopeptide (TPR) repeat protein
MRHRPLGLILLAILALVLAVPAGAQQKPFTKEQIQGLVRDGIGDAMGARLVSQRGLDFAPTEDFLQSLKSAGASEAFLQALRAAKPPAPEANAATQPLTQVQVLSLVAGEVPNHRVAMLVQDRGIDFDPTSVFIGEVRLAGGDDELIAALKNAKVIRPEGVDPTVQAHQSEVRQHTARGAQLLKTKQYPQAEAEYRAALALDPQNSDLHNSLAFTLGREGNWDGQITEEREALRLNPNSDIAHVGLGVALLQKGDENSAISEYHEAIRLNPNNDQAHINLGNRFAHRGDWDAADVEYREAIRLNPNNDQAHNGSAGVLMHNKDLDGAIAQYREAVRVNPNSEQNHLNLGVALSQKGDQDGAIAEYREVIRLNPSNEQAHINLGNRLSFKNDWEGATAEYAAAARLNTGNPVAHYSLGMAFEHQGNRQAALQEYRTAYQLNPQNASYQKAYERLNGQASQ